MPTPTPIHTITSTCTSTSTNTNMVRQRSYHEHDHTGEHGPHDHPHPGHEPTRARTRPLNVLVEKGKSSGESSLFLVPNRGGQCGLALTTIFCKRAIIPDLKGAEGLKVFLEMRRRAYLFRAPISTRSSILVSGSQSTLVDLP